MFINQSTCPVDLFLNNMYQFEKTSPEEMRNLLIHEDRRIVLPEQIISIPGKKDSFLTILEPLYTDYETVRGMCLFFIRASDLEHFVNSRLDKSKLIKNGFQPLPTWQDALERYLKEIL